MKVIILKNKEYKLPNELKENDSKDFRRDMYIHLINWKWKHITKEAGTYNYKGKEIEYDAILPKSVREDLKNIFDETVRKELKLHRKKFYFKFHTHFYHMASSQAANVNLFLPILLNLKANEILRKLKSDFNTLATEELYKGFRIEYWDEISETGLLGDHSKRSGTDADLAIAYFNHSGERCLWLIEHKLTEKEFTTCGGFKSENNLKKSNCDKSFKEILKDKNLCYYHNVRKFEYWNITATNNSFFINHSNHSACPFKKGMNQLWRNQLLALSLEKNNFYKHVYFSVVRHPDNYHLENTIKSYKHLIGNNPKFSSFTSKDVIDKATSVNDPEINKWIEWYKDLYKIS